METQKNSEFCWYKDVCTQQCDPQGCLTYIQLKWQMDNCGLPKSKQFPMRLYITDSNRMDKAAYTELAQIRRDIMNFVDEGRNLCIVSEHTGNGKTSWAIRLLQSYLHHTAPGNYENLQGMFISVPELLIRLKDFADPLPARYKQQIQEVDLVVWDEIALTGISQYDYNQLYVLIEGRIRAGKSNIFTGNCVDPQELEKILGARLTSRIWNSSRILQFNGLDERR